MGMFPAVVSVKQLQTLDQVVTLFLTDGKEGERCILTVTGKVNGQDVLLKDQRLQFPGCLHEFVRDVSLFLIDIRKDEERPSVVPP